MISLVIEMNIPFFVMKDKIRFFDNTFYKYSIFIRKEFLNKLPDNYKNRFILPEENCAEMFKECFLTQKEIYDFKENIHKLAKPKQTDLHGYIWQSKNLIVNKKQKKYEKRNDIQRVQKNT